MAGPYQEIIGVIGRAEFAVLAFVKVPATAENGLSNPHGLLLDVEARYCILTGIFLEIPDIIASVSVPKNSRRI